MGAGQIGGIATMLDFDFNNAAGFIGQPASTLDGQFVVYYLSHAMLFCAGVLIEPHIVLTPAICVYAETYKFDVFGGSHKFLEGSGSSRVVENICVHRNYNHTERWDRCYSDNIALLVLNRQFVFRFREPESEYILNRVRYGVTLDTLQTAAEENNVELKCQYYGWGSRRNGFLLPLLIQLRRVDVKVLEPRHCDEMWNTDNKYLCLSHPPCTNEKYGALCPDDLGSVVVCGGYVQGIMTSLLIDRPCGVGFLNIALYTKFLECAVDDSRDAMEYTYMSIPTASRIQTIQTVTVAAEETTQVCPDGNCAPKFTLPTETPMDKNAIIEDILSKKPEQIVDVASTKPSRLRSKRYKYQRIRY